MDHYAGIDVSLESASVCVIDATGRVAREAKVASEPAVLIAWFGSQGFAVTRIGLEAGPLSQWLYAALKEAGFAVELLETRHVCAALKAMPVKTDRHDARGIAQLMRLGWFRGGALQVAAGTGGPRPADGAQAAAGEAARRRDEPAATSPAMLSTISMARSRVGKNPQLPPSIPNGKASHPSSPSTTTAVPASAVLIIGEWHHSMTNLRILAH